MTMMTAAKMTMTPNFFKKLGLVFLLMPLSLKASEWSSNFRYLIKNDAQVRDFENYLFSVQTEEDAEEQDEHFVDLRTHSALIVKDGKIIYEKYAHGHHKDRPQKLWSISKSITHLLIAIAVKEKKISLSDTLCRYFKDYEMRLDCSKITIKDLLGMSSGISWQELLLDDPSSSSIFNMLYNKRGYKDSTSFILSHPLAQEPGSSWHYSSGDTNLLMAVLSKAYHPKKYAVLPWQKLFTPLGIHSAYWDKDKKGVFNGCCSLYLTARDLARIGQMILQKGRWMGRSYLPKGWMQEYIYSTPDSFFINPVLVIGQFVPSWHWVINKKSRYDRVSIPRALSGAPDDLLAAIGHAGQFLFIIPSMNTVFVRTGDSAGLYLDQNAMVTMALNIIRGGSLRNPIRKTPVPFSIGKESKAPFNYSKNRILLANNFTAKEMCSCMFIEKETKDQCMKDIRIKLGSIPSVRVLRAEKMVKASRFLMFPAKAHYRGRYGCTLE